MPTEPVEQQWPIVLALIVADAVYREPATGKMSILGIYSTISAREFPVTLSSLVVYVAITNGHGRTPIKVRLIDVDDERKPVLEAKATLNSPSPLLVAESVFVRKSVVFPRPGEYRLQLYGAGELLRERRLFVVAAPHLPPATQAQEDNPREPK